MLQFTIHNSQFTMNDKVSSIKLSASQTPTMKIDNCKLKIAIDREEIAS